MKKFMKKFLRKHLWFLFEDEKCEFCHGRLRRHGDNYYGGVDIHDSLGGSVKRTAYVCNLCYLLFRDL